MRRRCSTSATVPNVLSYDLCEDQPDLLDVVTFLKSLSHVFHSLGVAFEEEELQTPAFLETIVQLSVNYVQKRMFDVGYQTLCFMLMD